MAFFDQKSWYFLRPKVTVYRPFSFNSAFTFKRISIALNLENFGLWNSWLICFLLVKYLDLFDFFLFPPPQWYFTFPFFSSLHFPFNNLLCSVFILLFALFLEYIMLIWKVWNCQNVTYLNKVLVSKILYENYNH